MQKNRRVREATFVFASVIMLLTLVPAQIPVGASQTIGDVLEAVDGDRIIHTIVDLQNFKTRAFIANNSGDAADYLKQELERLGLESEIQDFVAGQHPSMNVIATQKGVAGNNSAHLFLVGAHYDSENSMASSLDDSYTMPAPGADDDASGVAVVIEVATVLSKFRLNYPIRYVAFGAEEAGYDRSGGLKGSSYYVDQEVARHATYEATAVIDMIGYRGNVGNHVVALSRGPQDPLAIGMTVAAIDQSLNISVESVVDPSISYSDHYSFWAAGYPSVLLSESLPGTPASYEFNPFYHSADDTVDHLSKVQMTEVAKALIGGIVALNGFAEERSSLLTVLLIGVVVCASAAVVLYIIIRRRGVK